MLRSLVVFSLVCLVLGCGGPAGPKVYPIKGTLTKGGLPLVVTNKMTGKIRAFLREVKPEGTAQVDVMDLEFNPDGTFSAPGPTRKGIQPGKYKLVVEFWEEDYPDPAKEKFKGAMSEDRSTAIVEVVPSQDLKIELDDHIKNSKPAVPKMGMPMMPGKKGG